MVQDIRKEFGADHYQKLIIPIYELANHTISAELEWTSRSLTYLQAFWDVIS